MEKRIGIFKVGTQKDGGYYIDQYLKNILRGNEINVNSYALHNKNEIVNGYTNININHKNPFAMFFKLKEIIKKEGLQIVYSNQFAQLFCFCIVNMTLLNKVYIIAKIDGKTIRNKFVKRVAYIVYDFLWDWAKKRSNFIIFENHKAKIGYRKRNCEIIYTPAVNFYKLNIEEYKKNNEIKDILGKRKSYSKCILYVGRYSYEKGYEYIGPIANELKTDLFITIGGHKKMFNNSENVIELGTLNITKIISFYEISDMLLVPSNDDSFPSVIREYSYFEKPIVATDVGAIREFKEILGLDINLCKPNLDSLCTEINKIKKHTILNNNKLIYHKYFNPNSPEITNKYNNIFNI